jgi:hypothetical protein
LGENGNYRDEVLVAVIFFDFLAAFRVATLIFLGKYGNTLFFDENCSSMGALSF